MNGLRAVDEALLARLKRNQRRGSKPRCHFLTHGSAEDVAARLTRLIAPFGSVSPDDRWMPEGFEKRSEAQLHKATRLLERKMRDELTSWWLAAASRKAMTPNWDIASTCTIEGKRGLLLVEAKAHDDELNKEACGRKLDADSSADRRASHEQILGAIEAARAGIASATSLRCAIARDSHYQMSNRFAWTWKVAELGVPVVLVYLGFIQARDMNKGKERPFVDSDAWERLVLAHSETLFPSEVWGRRWENNGVPFVPLIRSMEQPLSVA